MQGMFWLAILGFAAVITWAVWHSRRKLAALRHAEEERFAAFMAQSTGRAAPGTAIEPPPATPTVPSTPPVATNGLAQQKLLFEAAHKAGEAGEPALAFQLYARLIARYPDSTFADQARAEAQAQKRKLAKG